MPPEDIYSPFANPNSFLGQPFLPRVVSAISSGARNIASSEDQFRSDVTSAVQQGVQNVGRLAANVGNALTFPIRAAQEAVSGTPLISGVALGRTAQTPKPSQAVPQLPSGATSYNVTRTSPAIPVPLPTFPSQASVGASMVTAPAPTLPTVAQPTPVPTGQQRVDTAVRYGTISATPQQLENLNARDTAYVGRTPEQQQALLAQVRANGANLAKTMQNFAQSRIPEAARVNLATPQGRFGQPLTNLFPQRTQFAALPQSRGAIGATGFGEMQRQQAESATAALRPSPLYAGLGIGGIGGGPQPAQPMVANNNLAERQRRRLFGTV